MPDLMINIGYLIVNTLRLTTVQITQLYEYFGIGSIFISCLFLYLAYRYFLAPMFGKGENSKGSDKVRKSMHYDKESAENG